MKSLFRNWTTRTARPTPAPVRRAHLGVEQLDRRDLPSTSGLYLGTGLGTDLLLNDGGSVRQRDLPLSSNFDPATGQLTVLGSDGNDSVAVSAFGSLVQVSLSSYSPGSVTTVGTTQYYAANSLRKILFQGYGGDDRFANSLAIPTTVYGGDGNDTIEAGLGADYVYGGAGNDILYAGAAVTGTRTGSHPGQSRSRAPSLANV